jgi:hypothetical protein
MKFYGNARRHLSFLFLFKKEVLSYLGLVFTKEKLRSRKPISSMTYRVTERQGRGDSMIPTFMDFLKEKENIMRS